MIPQKGQSIQCLLYNNFIIEGIVESWSDEKSVLKSFDGSSISIIQHTLKDIMAIKILIHPQKIQQTLEKNFEKIKEDPSSEFRIKSLAELKTLMNAQEKKIIAENLRQHTIDPSRKVSYEYPGFFKVQSSK